MLRKRALGHLLSLGLAGALLVGAAGMAGCSGAGDAAGSTASVAASGSAAGTQNGGASRGVAAVPGSSRQAEDSTGAQDEALEKEEGAAMASITLDINGVQFAATLEDNDTAAALAARLPMTLEMSELNGNEKYCYLDETLPAAAERPGTIEAGDIMLFGSDCLVLFYESFSTSYSYTRIGHVDDPSSLAEALGGGSATVSWG